MSSAVFRQIGDGTRTGKPERLFLAAISAFCSLQRPSRQEVSQVDDLTVPLFDCVSREARRFAAAALSECEHAPPELTRRLCDEPVDICAALLVRSRSLKDIDLIGLIGRHGMAHARAISRRANLNPSIVDLIRMLASAEPEEEAPSPQAPAAVTSESAAEAVRARLRGMMHPSDPGSRRALPAWGTHARLYEKLRSTALTGVPILFHTALADALDINLRQARRLAGDLGFGHLPAALRACGLSGEEAFLVAAAVHPSRFAHAEAIRLFLEQVESLDPAEAKERLRAWKGDTVAVSFEDRVPAGASGAPQNANDRPAAARLKA